MPDDRSLAFTRTYRAEYATVVAYCQNRVDDGELARDLAAEVFRALWARWDEPRRSERAWLLGVAHHLVVDEYRRRSRRRGTSTVTEDLADGRVAAGFERVEVRRALESLAAGEQELLRLRYWDDLSVPDIAQMLGVSVGAVWVRLSRARRSFSTAWDGAATEGVMTMRRSPR